MIHTVISTLFLKASKNNDSITSQLANEWFQSVISNTFVSWSLDYEIHEDRRFLYTFSSSGTTREEHMLNRGLLPHKINTISSFSVTTCLTVCCSKKNQNPTISIHFLIFEPQFQIKEDLQKNLQNQKGCNTACAFLFHR